MSSGQKFVALMNVSLTSCLYMSIDSCVTQPEERQRSMQQRKENIWPINSERMNGRSTVDSFSHSDIGNKKKEKRKRNTFCVWQSITMNQSASRQIKSVLNIIHCSCSSIDWSNISNNCSYIERRCLQGKCTQSVWPLATRIKKNKDHRVDSDHRTKPPVCIEFVMNTFRLMSIVDWEFYRNDAILARIIVEHN
jgi:hypothetical protein